MENEEDRGARQARERLGRRRARLCRFAAGGCVLAGLAGAAVTAVMRDLAGVEISAAVAVGGGLFWWLQSRAWAGFAERNREREGTADGPGAGGALENFLLTPLGERGPKRGEESPPARGIRRDSSAPRASE